MSATLQKAVFGDRDPVKVEKFRSKTEKQFRKMREREQGKKRPMPCADWTDAELLAAVDSHVAYWLGSISGKMMFRSVEWVDAK